MIQNKKSYVASVISMNLHDFFEEIQTIENSQISGYHFDVMDGSFVPRLGLPPEYLEAVCSRSDLPVEVHMMVTDPERYFELFLKSGGDSLIPHFESMKNPAKTLDFMDSLGIEKRIAINPDTPLELLEPILEQLDNVTLMAIRPGIKGSKLIEATYLRLETLKMMIAKTEKKIFIEIDGGVTFQNAARLYEESANSLVCGAGTIFSSDNEIRENLNKMDEILIESQNAN